MDGLLIVDKPAGWTSHDVVARARRLLREKRVGHTGTLDPFATGVLVLLVGRATRLAQFLAGAEKEHEATIRLGYATTTGDLTGERRERAEAGGGAKAPDEDSKAGAVVPDRAGHGRAPRGAQAHARRSVPRRRCRHAGRAAKTGRGGRGGARVFTSSGSGAPALAFGASNGRGGAQRTPRRGRRRGRRGERLGR